MTTTTTIDFDAVFNDIVARLKRDDERRIQAPLVRIWDGNWTLVGEVHREISAKFTLPENETGVGTIELPASYYLSKWLTSYEQRSVKNVFITVDKDGARWSGMLDDLELYKDEDGQRIIRAKFLSDFEHLKHILAYCNPFLPPELQFPRVWILAPAPVKWALKLTLFFNILRLESSLWALPDDPLDPSKWFNLDQSTWSQVVAPTRIEDDNSILGIVHSRMKSMYDVQKSATADAQLTWEPRRYLDGDPPPWEGADLRHGTLVWDLVDNSGWDKETSFGGTVFDGLVRSFVTIASDGMTQGIDYIDDPTFPPEYEEPGWKGTIPRAPGLILRDGERTGIQTNSFHWKPATDVGFVAGGHSTYGVNEAISGAINMAGDLIAAALFIPPIGGMLDAFLKPLYTDTVLAWMKWKDVGRAQELGWSHYHETFCEGADRAYTLSALIALRTGMWRTREQTSHSVTVADGVEGLRIGQRGRGNAWLGTRIGTTVRDWGVPGRVYVDRITQLELAWSRTMTPLWTLIIGAREQEDPFMKGLEMIKEVMAVARDLGVL